MTDHTVRSYDAELEALGRKIAEMGGIAEKMLSDAMDALANLDINLARATVATDVRLDVLQRDVEEQAIMTIARRQPFAADLREIVAAIRISGDLERVGDLAKNIAKRALKLSAETRMQRAIVGLKSMHETAAMLLKDALDAYAMRDVERARQVWTNDVELDALEDSVFRDLLTFMMEDPRNISFCAHLLFCLQEHRAHRRPFDQYRRDRGLSRHRRGPADGSAEGLHRPPRNSRKSASER